MGKEASPPPVTELRWQALAGPDAVAGGAVVEDAVVEGAVEGGGIAHEGGVADATEMEVDLEQDVDLGTRGAGVGFTGGDILDVVAPYTDGTVPKWGNVLRMMVDHATRITEEVAQNFAHHQDKASRNSALPSGYSHYPVSGTPERVMERLLAGSEVPKLKCAAWEFTDTLPLQGLAVGELVRLLGGSSDGTATVDTLTNISKEHWQELVGDKEGTAYSVFPSDWPETMLPYRVDLAFTSGHTHSHYATLRLHRVGTRADPQYRWMYCDWYAEKFGLTAAETGVHLPIAYQDGKVSQLVRYATKVLPKCMWLAILPILTNLAVQIEFVAAEKLPRYLLQQNEETLSATAHGTNRALSCHLDSGVVSPCYGLSLEEMLIETGNALPQLVALAEFCVARCVDTRRGRA